MTRLTGLILLAGAFALAACGSVKRDVNDDGCDTGLTDCDGVCVDIASDEANCGACDSPCGAEQACLAETCEDFSTFAIAEFETTPLDPTGWVTSDGDPISFTFTPIDEVDDEVYECRTGPAMMLGSIPFAPCDDGDGSTPTHTPVPNATQEEGSYRTEVRVRIGDFISEVAGFDFYAHRSLDSVPTCPHTLTDAEIFAAAGAELLGANPPAFGANTETRNPFIQLPFVNVQPNAPAQQPGTIWANIAGGNFTVQARSLRRRFALSPNGQLLLVQRQYVSRRAVAEGITDMARLCRNGITYTVGAGTQRDGHVDCNNMVLNSQGESRCIRDDNGTAIVEFPSTNGFIKLGKKDFFSPKGMGPTCPSNLFNPGACQFDYLVLPL